MKIQTTPERFRRTPEEARFFEEMKRRVNIATVADLNQTITGPSIAEVQAISDKVDELLAALRAPGLMEK